MPDPDVVWTRRRVSGDASSVRAATLVQQRGGEGFASRSAITFGEEWAFTRGLSGNPERISYAYVSFARPPARTQGGEQTGTRRRRRVRPNVAAVSRREWWASSPPAACSGIGKIGCPVLGGFRSRSELAGVYTLASKQARLWQRQEGVNESRLATAWRKRSSGPVLGPRG